MFLHYKKFKKNKLKGFLQRILQEIMKKKIILGTSDTWLMSPSSNRPRSDPKFYIEYCRIFNLLICKALSILICIDLWAFFIIIFALLYLTLRIACIQICFQLFSHFCTCGFYSNDHKFYEFLFFSQKTRKRKLESRSFVVYQSIQILCMSSS